MTRTYTRTLTVADRTVTARFTHAALCVLEETGSDPQVMLDSLLDGVYTLLTLLESCLDGADDDRADGWHDVVNALANALEGVTLTGRAAINVARWTDRTLSKYADPVEGARTGLTVDDARAIAAVDPGLIYLAAEATA